MKQKSIHSCRGQIITEIKQGDKRHYLSSMPNYDEEIHNYREKLSIKSKN